MSDDADWFEYGVLVLLVALSLAVTGVGLYYAHRANSYNEQTVKYERQAAEMYARAALCAKDYHACVLPSPHP